MKLIKAIGARKGGYEARKRYERDTERYETHKLCVTQRKCTKPRTRIKTRKVYYTTKML